DSYRQIGVASDVVERGVEFTSANLWVNGRQVGRVQFGAIGAGITAFPYMVIFPQDEHERLLIDRLRASAVEIERPVELVHFDDRGDHIVARLRRPDGGEESCEAAYVAGCDGAHSKVR